MTYRIQEFDAVWSWQTIDEADSLEDALIIASSHCSSIRKNSNKNTMTPQAFDTILNLCWLAALGIILGFGLGHWLTSF